MTDEEIDEDLREQDRSEYNLEFSWSEHDREEQRLEDLYNDDRG